MGKIIFAIGKGLPKFVLNSYQGIRLAHSRSIDFKSIVREKILSERERVHRLKKQYGSTQIGTITVDMIYQGMRGMPALICETSELDPNEGIRFRGLSVDECIKQLPKAPGCSQPLPEAMFWLLMTGEVPNSDQTTWLSNQWYERSNLPDHVHRLLRSIPSHVHPMRQFSAILSILGDESKFEAYYRSTPKALFWENVYEDTMDLIAKLPTITAHIYNNSFRDRQQSPRFDTSTDWAHDFTRRISRDSRDFTELMRLYFTIHADHEGGNVSAHSVHLAGSALSDPYLCLANGINGLAGSLHGLANQEVMIWLENLQKVIGLNPTDNEIREYVFKSFNSGVIIPGYGHAVLRKTDPRYTCQREFGMKHMSDDRLFRIASKLYDIVPPILMESGKVKNPWPNVDALSGTLLNHYNMKEKSFYTVLFGMSRALGVLSQLVWSRGLGFPIERPKSLSTNSLIKMLEKNS